MLVPCLLHAQRAPIFLEPGHWSYDAIRRLNAAGVAPPSSDPSLAPVTLQHARAVFEFAVAEAERRGRNDIAQHAAAYAALLTRADSSSVLAHAELRAGWLQAVGDALAGDGYFQGEDWEGAQLLTRANGPAAAGRAHGWLHPRLGWSVDGGWLADEVVLNAATASLALGPFDVWAGRRRLHYGAGRGGAVVLGSGLGTAIDIAQHTSAAIDGIGLHTRQPFVLPGFLRALGPDRIEIIAARLPRNGNVESPYVVFGRITGMPFSRRITLGINRGAIFGGEGNSITFRRLAGLLTGLHGGEAGEFENQVFSVIARYRPPLGALPLELYYERGMDDTAGGFFDVPAVIAGIDVAALPGLPAASFGLEHTRFAPSCCGNPIWYRSVFFRGSWADEGRIFAHPLGGHGNEWLMHARVDLPARGLLLRADGYVRDRGDENLFAPERAGRTIGTNFGLEYFARNGIVLRLDAGVEDGRGWSAHRVIATLAYGTR